MATLTLQAGELSSSRTISNERLIEIADRLVVNMNQTEDPEDPDSTQIPLTNQEKLDGLMQIIVRLAQTEERKVRRQRARDHALQFVNEQLEEFIE